MLRIRKIKTGRVKSTGFVVEKHKNFTIKTRNFTNGSKVTFYIIDIV